MQILRVLSSVAFAMTLLAASSTAEASDASRRLSGGNAACRNTARVRKPWQSLTANEKSLYKEAVVLAMQKGLFTDLAAIHIDDMSEHQAHHTCAFLTWHRRLLLAYESYLRDMNPKFACLTIPYYDATSAYVDAANRKCRDMVSCSTIFDELGGARNGRATWQALNGVDTWGIPQADSLFANLCDDNGRCGSITRNDLRGRPVPSSAGLASIQDAIGTSPDYAYFLGRIQYGVHNEIHNAIGGAMATFASPRDPIFFSWHSAIDMYLYTYQQCHVGKPMTAEEQQASWETFAKLQSTCGGDVDNSDGFVMNIRVNGQLMDVTRHPTLGKYFSFVGDKQWKFTDTNSLGDYSYKYDVPAVINSQILNNGKICKSFTPPTPPPATAAPTNQPPTEAPTTQPPTQAPTQAPSTTPNPIPTQTPASTAGGVVPTPTPVSTAGGVVPTTTPVSTAGGVVPTPTPVSTAAGVVPTPTPSNSSSVAPATPTVTPHASTVAPSEGPSSDPTSAPPGTSDTVKPSTAPSVGPSIAPSTYSAPNTAQPEGDYWSWFQKTYDGLMKRCNGDVKLVSEQMHYIECITFDGVFGIRNFSDEFVKNFNLNSNRPLCKRKIDLVKEGNVTLAVNITIATTPAVNITGTTNSTDATTQADPSTVPPGTSVQETIAPGTKATVVEAPKPAFNAESVVFAPKEVIKQVVEHYEPPKAGDNFPFVFTAPMPMPTPASTSKLTPAASQVNPSATIGEVAGEAAVNHPRCG